jgi:hypothetical protein
MHIHSFPYGHTCFIVPSTKPWLWLISVFVKLTLIHNNKLLLVASCEKSLTVRNVLYDAWKNNP